MKTLYVDCQMGAAGDMLMAALLDILDDKEEFLKRMRNLGLSGVDASYIGTVREGHEGIQVHICAEDKDCADGRTLSDVHQIIDGLNASERVKADAKGVYQIIAEAEAVVHETETDLVHFHEVGARSAIADISGVCLLMEMLNPEHIIVSPIHVGSGTVKCAHGILPVPAPATAKIVEHIPYYSGDVQGELCTPTGAALLRYFADEFGNCPDICDEKRGRGFGTKLFPGRPNGLVTIFGEKR